MNEAQPNLTPINLKAINGSAAIPKPPLDMSKITLILAVIMGLFGGGSYAVSPWATASDFQELKAKVDTEIKQRKAADLETKRLIKAIAKKVGAEIPPAPILEEEPDTQE